jgi:glycosyltransferase involved in cell wall biosynthesis
MPASHPSISIIIPAWNEEHRIALTLKGIHSMLTENPNYPETEIIVVDDGSKDRTYDAAASMADKRIRHTLNCGKGAALETGLSASKGDILVFLDADLEQSASCVKALIQPVLEGEADMAIAKFPPAQRSGGFGLVKGLASRGIYLLSGFRPTAPLSGQRAVRREVLEYTGRLSKGFGIEVGLTIDAARAGFKLQEIIIPFKHRETGRDLKGFVHRGRQFIAVSQTLINRWRKPIC